MAEFDDNEEMQRFRAWWSKNGTALALGVLIAALVVAGWYGWQWYTDRQDTQAAGLYAKVEYGIANDKVTGGVKNLVAKLKDDYSGTPYAGAAALTMGAYQVNQNHLDKAAAELDWAMHNADGKAIRQVATVRKARILWAQGKTQDALQLLEHDHPSEFDALYAELAGDIHTAQGDQKAAHKAYKKALAALPSDASKGVLQQKLRESAPVAAGNDKPTDRKTADS
jgi:predicted negative regulator of RcsB-dependent stress response